MHFAANTLVYNAFRAKSSFRIVTVALFASLATIFTGFSATGQEIPKATVCTQGVISLPENESLASVYVIDFSDMAFASDQEMITFCSSFTTEEFLVRANPEKQEGVIMLQMKGRSDWTVHQWNSLFQSRCEAKPLLKN